MLRKLFSSIFELLIALIAVFASGGVASITITSLNLAMESSPLWPIFHRSIYIPLVVLAFYALRRILGNWNMKNLGFTRGEGFKANLRDGVIAFSAISLAWLPFVLVLMQYYAAQFLAYEEIIRSMSIPMLMLMVTALVPITFIDSPVPEEIIYRAYHQGMLSERFNQIVGISASTIFFGLSHAISHPDWHPGMVIATIPAGLILALTYCKTKSLVSVIIAHFLLNFLPEYPMILYVSGNTLIGILTCLVIAFTSTAILILFRYRARELLIDGLRVFRHLNIESVALASLLATLSLTIVYLAAHFKSLVI